MGIPAKSLGKAARAAAGVTLVGGRARPPLGPPLAGHALLVLRLDPPAVTHHDKRIVRRPGGGHQLADSPELVAARLAYERAVPERPGPYFAPLRPPVVLRVTFVFADAAVADGRAAPAWHAATPDLDNQVKLLKDVLALRGYVANDSHVALEVLAKRTAAAACVRVYLRTLLGPDDYGAEHPIGAGPAHHGVIQPLEALAHLDLNPKLRAAVLGERPYPGGAPGGGKSGAGREGRADPEGR